MHSHGGPSSLPSSSVSGAYCRRSRGARWRAGQGRAAGRPLGGVAGTVPLRPWPGANFAFLRHHQAGAWWRRSCSIGRPTAWACSRPRWRGGGRPRGRDVSPHLELLPAHLLTAAHRLGDPLGWSHGGGQAVDLADEAGEGPAGSRGRTPGRRPDCAFLTSTRVWKNVVTGSSAGAAGSRGGSLRRRARAAGAAAQPRGGGGQQVGPELRDAVVVVAEHDVGRGAPRSSPRASSWSMSLTTATLSAVDVEALPAGDLVHPLAAVRGADPQRPVDAEGLQAQGAPVQEDVLARVRPEALAEEDDPRAAPSCRRSRSRMRSHSSRFCSRACPTRPSDGGEGRRSTAWSPRPCRRGTGTGPRPARRS